MITRLARILGGEIVADSSTSKKSLIVETIKKALWRAMKTEESKKNSYSKRMTSVKTKYLFPNEYNYSYKK